MRQEIIIPIPAIPATQRKQLVVICDVCKEDEQTRSQHTVCMLCKRDLCLYCAVSDPECPGDYPNDYCKICYKLKFETHAGMYKSLEDKYDAELEKLENIIKKLSLDNTPFYEE